jgi:hypothetical protein
MKTFVRVTEVWIPTRDRTALELGQGAYGDLVEFGEASRSLRFAYDAGLPGKAWTTRKPVVLRSFEGTCFMRTDAAAAAGLSTAVALPIFAGDVLTAVVVFFCGSDPDLAGAIELWDDCASEERELCLTEGFYGAASSFEWISRGTRFRHGHGLPGMVSASGMPQLMADLGRSAHFLRADSALRAGIEHGLGVPGGKCGGSTSVVTFLSGYETPIARRIGIWGPNEARDALVFREGYCDIEPDFGKARAETSIAYGEGPIGTPARTGVPIIVESLAAETDPICVHAASIGLTSLLVLPILEDGSLRAIVTMYF